MSLLSFLRKNKQESTSDDSAFYSRAEEESKAVRSRKRRATTQGAKGDAPVDPVLPEKKRARRRLIGAVALVLAAIIGLPMILDSEPKPVADDIAIQIPSKDKPVAAPASRPAASGTDSTVSATSSLDPKEEVMESIDSAGDAKPASPKAEAPRVALATPSTPATKSAEDKHAADSNKLAQDKAPALAKADTKLDTKADVKPEPKQQPKPVEKITDKPADKNADKAAEAARAKALLEGKPDPTAAEKKSSKFVIQVAALATKEKVNELQTKLKDAGIHSYTQKVATDAGDRTRIRVGPFANKDEAEKIRAKIVKLGLNGTLVPA
jgi:DedD protein